ASASYGEKRRSRVNGSRCERERTPLFTASVVAEIGVRSVNVFVPREDEDNERASELNPPEHAHSYGKGSNPLARGNSSVWIVCE
ncbi:uncharacterized, partial [Tachysurus ichikawai]